MKLLASLVGEQQLLPHFIKHYTSIGITEFHFATQRDTHFPKQASNVNIYPIYDGPPCMDQDTITVRNLQLWTIAADEWFVIADGDEFVRDSYPLNEIVAEAEAKNCVWVLGRLVDRIARDCGLPPVSPDSDLDALFPQRLLFTQFLGGPINKAVLIKGQTLFSPGHHYCHGNMLDMAIEIDHYKWHAAVIKRLKRRVDLYRELGYEWRSQSENFLTLIADNGRIDLSRFPDLM